MLNQDNSDHKKRINVTIVWFAVAILAILIVINFSPIASFGTMITSIASPVIVGGAIAYLLNPILKFLEFVVFKKLKSKKLARVLSLILTYVYAILVITLVISVIAPQFAASIADIATNYNGYIDSVLGVINGIIAKISSNMASFDAAQAKEMVTEIFSESGDIIKDISNYLVSYGKSLFEFLKNLFIGLFISIYILVSKERLYAQSVKVARAFLSEKAYNNCLKYLRITNATFGRFFIGKLFDSTIVFILTLFILLLLGIPHAVLVAMIVAVLNVIPFFGFIIGIFLSSFIVLIAAPEKILIYIVIMFILEQIDANVIAPKILGSSAGISSLGVIIAVSVMGSYFGIVGMILGVPIFAIIISIVREWLNKRLSAKNLPVSTADYYDNPNYSIDSEEHKSITRLIFDPLLIAISKKINNTVSHNLKKYEDDATASDEYPDADEAVDSEDITDTEDGKK